MWRHVVYGAQHVQSLVAKLVVAHAYRKAKSQIVKHTNER